MRLETKIVSVLVLLGVVVVGFIIWAAVFIVNYKNPASNQVPSTPAVPASEETEIDTSEWQTYRSEKYRFEFQYPPVPSCGFCKIGWDNDEGFSVNRTSLNVEDLGGLTLAQFVDQTLEGEELEIESKDKIFIGGKEGIAVAYRFGGMGRYGNVSFVESDKKVIIFEFTAGVFCCPEGDSIYEFELYDAMLSTFKFIK